MDQYTRRIIGFGVLAGNVDGPALCRMFNHATSGQGWPTHISSDNDPLFQYHQWKANLRVLDIDEIKSLPQVREYQCYYNECRTHSGRNGTTPASPENGKVIDINEYRWQKHCRGVFHLPVPGELVICEKYQILECKRDFSTLGGHRSV